MTRRERLERKLERRAEWAAGRRSKAAALLRANEPFRGDHAFNTQPGHIPERARAIARSDRAFEHENVARHHDSAAAGLSWALDRSIFSDDRNAAEALRARIEANEAKRARMREVNRLFRKGDAAGLAALGLDLEALRRRIAEGPSYVKAPFEGWEMSNLGNRIQADRKRLAQVESQAKRAAEAEAAGGVSVERLDRGFLRVTFTEKPAREVLSALRAAGYQWGGGSWLGRAEKFPAEVGALLAPCLVKCESCGGNWTDCGTCGGFVGK